MAPPLGPFLTEEEDDARVTQSLRPPVGGVVPVRDDDATPPRGPGWLGVVVVVLVIVAIVAGSVIVVLTLYVPQEYLEHQYLSLSESNGWRSGVCIPVDPDSVPINVSFSWTTSDHSVVQLWAGFDLPWTQDPAYAPAYAATASQGSGWIETGSTDTSMQFEAVGTPALPPYVNITLSYDVPGHYLIGPSTPTSC